MKTVIETFLMEDTENLVLESDDLKEWTEKCKELELDGQLSLTENDKSPIPYMYMNKSMVKVFETHCPMKKLVEAFKEMPIPLEVLSHIALSRQEGYFDRIEIWFDDKSPDPVAVGTKGDDWNGSKYLIGRWGAEKMNFESLKELARVRWMNEQTVKTKARIAELQHQINTMDTLSHQFIGGEWISSLA